MSNDKYINRHTEQIKKFKAGYIQCLCEHFFNEDSMVSAIRDREIISILSDPPDTRRRAANHVEIKTIIFKNNSSNYKYVLDEERILNNFKKNGFNIENLSSNLIIKLEALDFKLKEFLNFNLDEHDSKFLQYICLPCNENQLLHYQAEMKEFLNSEYIKLCLPVFRFFCIQDLAAHNSIQYINVVLKPLIDVLFTEDFVKFNESFNQLLFYELWPYAQSLKSEAKFVAIVSAIDAAYKAIPPERQHEYSCTTDILKSCLNYGSQIHDKIQYCQENLPVFIHINKHMVDCIEKQELLNLITNKVDNILKNKLSSQDSLFIDRCICKLKEYKVYHYKVYKKELLQNIVISILACITMVVLAIEGLLRLCGKKNGLGIGIFQLPKIPKNFEHDFDIKNSCMTLRNCKEIT